MPFYLAGSEKNLVLPGVGFREFYMFATERLWLRFFFVFVWYEEVFLVLFSGDGRYGLRRG